MNDSTKVKILEAAHKLFAQKGLHGVSVREIAAASEANVAAINYHFKNKENLYAQTILNSMKNVEQAMYAIKDEVGEDDPVLFSQKILDYFMENSEELRSVIIMISSSDDAPSELIEQMQQYKGPPGGQVLQDIIKKNYPKATQDDLEWVMRSIIGIIMHKSMIMCNKSICSSMEEIGVTHATFREETGRLMRALLRDLAD